MICEEVIELMQRDLDDDLSNMESERLLHHIEDCNQCNDMYLRLQRISGELSSLPKVAPAFSLVDAILPELDQIDQMKLLLNNSTNDHDGAIGRTHAATFIKKRSWRSSLSLKIAGGIAAAGVAALLLINYDSPATFNSADEFHPEAHLESTDSSLSMKQRINEDENDGYLDEMALANDDQADAASTPDMFGAIDDPGVKNESVDSDLDSPTEQSQRIEKLPTISSDNHPESRNKTDDSSELNSSNESLAIPEIKDDELVPEGSLTEDMDDNELQGIMGIPEVSPEEFPSPLLSPDGSKFAVVELVHGIKQVVAVDANFLPIVATDFSDAVVIRNIKWSFDSLVIEIEVERDGMVDIEKLNVIENSR